MTSADIRMYEDMAADRRYAIKVKVNKSGETLVTLTNTTTGNAFEGAATARTSQGYARALNVAVDRMVAFERRFE